MARPSEAVVKRLFAVSGNQCAYPDCQTPLIDAPTGVVTGRICHIRAQSPGGPRYVEGLSDAQLHSFENLVLMCPVHHDVIDGREDLFPVDRLEEIKQDHEAKFAGGVEPSDAVATSLLKNSGLLEELVKLTREQVRNSEERDRPRFEVWETGVSRLISNYQPQWKGKQVSGDIAAAVEWRFRGPRFSMEPHHAQGSKLGAMTFSHQFDITQILGDDPLLAANEIGFELRFYWHDRWRVEIHRYPLSFQTTQDGRELANVGDEILPSLELDQETEATASSHPGES